MIKDDSDAEINFQTEDMTPPLVVTTDSTDSAGPSNKSMTHFNISSQGSLHGQTKILTLDDIQKGAWVLVSYESEVYVGQVLSVHPDHPDVGKAARVRCLKKPFTVDPDVPQDFEPIINWIFHPLANLYYCPVSVRQAIRNRKTLWWYQSMG